LAPNTSQQTPKSHTSLTPIRDEISPTPRQSYLFLSSTIKNAFTLTDGSNDVIPSPSFDFLEGIQAAPISSVDQLEMPFKRRERTLSTEVPTRIKEMAQILERGEQNVITEPSHREDKIRYDLLF
jgi:hypothetical protein